MPIKRLSVSGAGDCVLIQRCAVCGAEHSISFDRAAAKSKTGPFVLRAGDTLAVELDGETTLTAALAADSALDFSSVTAAQLASAWQPQLPGARLRDDAGGLLMESKRTGPESGVRIVGGTCAEALGFAVERADPCSGRPVLGVDLGGDHHDANVIALRRCHDCGSHECLVRTFDRAAPDHPADHFHQHRFAVNALAQHCKRQGWSHPACAGHHAVEAHEPPDIDTRFPAEPITLRHP